MSAFQRFRKHPPAMIGLAILLLFIVAGLAAPLLTQYDPTRQRLIDAYTWPSFNPQRLLGTDHLGRDLTARILYGTRASLMVGVLTVLVGMGIGVPIGAVSGYFGGWVDMLVQRLLEIMFAMPGIILALIIGSIMGAGLLNVVVAIGVGIAPSFIRLVRAQVLQVREREYIEASRALGANSRHIILTHILRNSLAPVIVQATIGLSAAIPAAAGLSLLGLGVDPNTPEWGRILAEGRLYILSYPYMAIVPGLTIFLASLSFNLMSDGIRAMVDPRGA